MLKEEKIMVTIGPPNKKYYSDLGYDVGVGVKEIEVNQQDVHKNSVKVKLNAICDFCGKEY